MDSAEFDRRIAAIMESFERSRMEDERRHAEWEQRNAAREAEDAKRKAEREAEDARRKAEREAEDARRKAEREAEEARRKAEWEMRKAEDEQRKAALEAEEARRKAEWEMRKAEDEQRKAALEAEETQRKAEEARRNVEREAEEAKRKAKLEAEEARRKAEWEQNLAEWERRRAETDRQIDKVAKQMGNINENIGSHAEQFFQSAFEKKLEFGGIKYDEMIRNLRHKGRNDEIEFDIVLVNGDSIAIIEVKNRIHPSFVKQLAEERMKIFRKHFRDFDGYSAYLGIAGFSFSDFVVEEASRYGVGIIRQVGDSMEMDAVKLKAY
ncbi:MAG: hypothetical protein FWH22_03220 [Fibromonadales bacterium]|nr:hypothetical protein [Fibromonadales bacterium]